MKLHALLTLGLLGLVGVVAAQESPVNSPDYHAIHNPQSPYYVGPRQQPAAPPPPQPTGYWEKTWGAIAPSPVGGVLGTAVGASSKEEAEQLALEDCKAKGGGACKVEIAYHNQCGAMVIGSNELFTASGGSTKDAEDVGIKYCQKHDANCRVYYSACTKPIYHEY